MTPLAQWHHRVLTLTTAIDTVHPEHRLLLGDIDNAAFSLVTNRPLAEHHHDPGDGLRSPNLEGGATSKGTHADPVFSTAERTTPTYEPGSKRAADTFRVIDAQQANTVLWLTRARDTGDNPDLLRRRLREALDQLASAVSSLHAMLPPPSPPKEAKTRTGDPGCRSCARIPKPDGTGHWWVSTRVGERGRSVLCHWCERRTLAAKVEWVEAHPGQEPPADQRFWPPKRAVEWRRDEGDRRISPQTWDQWVAEERKARKGKRRKAA